MLPEHICNDDQDPEGRERQRPNRSSRAAEEVGGERTRLAHVIALFTPLHSSIISISIASSAGAGIISNVLRTNLHPAMLADERAGEPLAAGFVME